MKLDSITILKDKNDYQLNLSINSKEINILITTMELSDIHENYTQHELGFLREDSHILFKKLLTLENTVKNGGFTKWN